MASSSSSIANHSWGALRFWSGGLEAQVSLSRLKHGACLKSHTKCQPCQLFSTVTEIYTWTFKLTCMVSVTLQLIQTEQVPCLNLICFKSLYTVHTPFAYVLEKFGDNPCSSLMVLCTRGVQTGGDETLTPPLGRVESSEEVLTRIWTVSIGGILPRFTTNTVLSKSSSISMCPETSQKKTKNTVGVSLSPLFTPVYKNDCPNSWLHV